MRYTNTTKTSVFAGGKWVAQGGVADIPDPNAVEQSFVRHNGLDIPLANPSRLG